MCGIVGLCRTERGSAPPWLARGRDAIKHRGPDDAGEFWSPDGTVGLAHRRLSIIDLTETGHQPMPSSDGRLWLIFNGEIYNFRELRQELEAHGASFRTSSDSEVILAAYRKWGADCLGRLNGMFALAIYDQDAKTVLLARDRAGEKPLFYAEGQREIRFASELKALMSDPTFPRRVDQSSLDCYLAMGFVPGDRCILDGVKKLPAGHALLFDCASGRVQRWRYWSPPDYAPEPNESLDALLEEFEVLFEDAVQRQLIADVPVGLLLSGGVDSSLVTAMAARRGRHLSTYTVGFTEFPDYDESRHARLVAEYFGTDHTELKADSVEPDILPQLARQYDEPIIDSSMIPTFLVCKQIRARCKVALGGDGGDELFGGYYSHSRMAELQRIRRRVPAVAGRAISRTAERTLPMGYKGRPFAMMLGIDVDVDVPIFHMQFDRTSRRQLMSAQPAWPYHAEDIRRRRIPRAVDPVDRVTRLDFADYMAEDILVKVDRASMLNSLEMRCPFLDHRLIEFAFGRVPSRFKAAPGERKILLRKFAEKVLPPEFDRTRKQGFGIPLGHWLRGGAWRKLFESVLLDSSSVFSRSSVESLFRGVAAARPVNEQLFGLTLFELWRKEYGVSM